jgi:hypothetical protein
MDIIDKAGPSVKQIFGKRGHSAFLLTSSIPQLFSCSLSILPVLIRIPNWPSTIRPAICRRQILQLFTPDVRRDGKKIFTSKIHARKKSAAHSRKAHFQKSHKTHQNHTTFNQNLTGIVQNHTKTTSLFNTFCQNFSLFAFLRCREIALNQRTYASSFSR